VLHHAGVDRRDRGIDSEHLDEELADRLVAAEHALGDVAAVLREGDEPGTLVLDEVHLLELLEDARDRAGADVEAARQVADPGDAAVAAGLVQDLQVHLVCRGDLRFTMHGASSWTKRREGTILDRVLRVKLFLLASIPDLAVAPRSDST
jgi:hypothetical protein